MSTWSRSGPTEPLGFSSPVPDGLSPTTGPSRPLRILVDGMGGDHAPQEVVDGVVRVARETDYELTVVGDQAILERLLATYPDRPPRIRIHHAPDVIGMGESAAAAVRKKPNASICVAADLLKTQAFDALVTAGNTGAAVCATTLSVRLLEGVERPGIAVVMPTTVGATLVIDVGANVDPKPEHLLQYAIMGEVCARHFLQKPQPKIGLLSIGEEAEKGTDFIRRTHRLLEQSSINFVGNVEGHDLFTGKTDVIVCDGFVGNIALKVTESLAEELVTLLKLEISRSLLARCGGLLMRPTLRSLKRQIDAAEYGGAPLLGLNGTCIIAHGSSRGRAIKNAVLAAARFNRFRVNAWIVEALRDVKKNPTLANQTSPSGQIA